jgi:hypothetical protein
VTPERIRFIHALSAAYQTARARGTSGNDEAFLLANAVPELLAELEAREAELERLRTVHDAAMRLVSWGCSDHAFALLKRALGGNDAVARWEAAREAEEVPGATPGAASTVAGFESPQASGVSAQPDDGCSRKSRHLDGGAS